MTRYKHILLLPLLAVVVSCGPSLGSTIVLPQLNPSVSSNSRGSDSSYVSYIFVEEMVDARGSQAIAELDGRQINPRGEIGPVVIKGVELAFKKKGFEISDTAPVILLGQVRTWKARLRGGAFTSKAKAEAELSIDVLDPANKRVYSGLYKGYASVERPSLDEKKISKVLGTAMSEAISQMIKDKQMLKLLSSF